MQAPPLQPPVERLPHNKSVRGFWQRLIDEKLLHNETLTVLAPMADVTDTAFRELIAAYGKPDVMWTEFVSADGLASAGREVLKRDLEFTESERPIVAQLFTSNPENMFKAARLCKELGFDGIDINMGCPDSSIEKQGAGAAHIKNPTRAQEVIRAAQEGADGLPVSVKTRIGYNKIEWREWIGALLEMNLPAITLHLRTRKEMSLVPAHWEIMPDIVKLVREMTGGLEEGGTILIGNGDVTSLSDGRERARESGCDGVMIGRGIFGNPWLFNKNKKIEDISVPEKMAVMIEHSKLFEELLGNIKSFHIMRKHYKAYANGFDGAGELRAKLMEAKDFTETKNIVGEFLRQGGFEQAPVVK